MVHLAQLRLATQSAQGAKGISSYSPYTRWGMVVGLERGFLNHAKNTVFYRLRKVILFCLL